MCRIRPKMTAYSPTLPPSRKRTFKFKCSLSPYRKPISMERNSVFLCVFITPEAKLVLSKLTNGHVDSDDFPLMTSSSKVCRHAG